MIYEVIIYPDRGFQKFWIEGTSYLDIKKFMNEMGLSSNEFEISTFHTISFDQFKNKITGCK